MDRLYTQDELAEHLRVSPKTLVGWRARGIGPRFFRPGGRTVRYRESAVREWEAEQEREATAALSPGRGK